MRHNQQVEVNRPQLKATCWRYCAKCTNWTGITNKTFVDEPRKAGKKWREVKALAMNTFRWEPFMNALCSLTEWNTDDDEPNDIVPPDEQANNQTDRVSSEHESELPIDISSNKKR